MLMKTLSQPMDKVQLAKIQSKKLSTSKNKLLSQPLKKILPKHQRLLKMGAQIKEVQIHELQSIVKMEIHGEHPTTRQLYSMLSSPQHHCRRLRRLPSKIWWTSMREPCIKFNQQLSSLKAYSWPKISKRLRTISVVFNLPVMDRNQRPLLEIRKGQLLLLQIL